MKHSILNFAVCGAILLISGCSEDNFLVPGIDQSDQVAGDLKSAKKPASSLKGTIELDFSFENPPVFWTGTVDFGDGSLYGIRFASYTPPRDFSQASPFEEYFEIYDLAKPTQVYLGGPDAGVTTLANKPPEPNKFRMNGEIEVATGPFTMWLGRHVHISGVLTWVEVGVPKSATALLRIN